jgi:hypothetical protein
MAETFCPVITPNGKIAAATTNMTGRRTATLNRVPSNAPATKQTKAAMIMWAPTLMINERL